MYRTLSQPPYGTLAGLIELVPPDPESDIAGGRVTVTVTQLVRWSTCALLAFFAATDRVTDYFGWLAADWASWKSFGNGKLRTLWNAVD